MLLFAILSEENVRSYNVKYRKILDTQFNKILFSSSQKYLLWLEVPSGY